MKSFIVTILIVAVAADRLDNVYLPPSNANTAGGNGNVLNAPIGNINGAAPTNQYRANGLASSAPSSQYGAPTGKYNIPSTNYGVPSGPAGSNGYSNIPQSPEAGAAILRFNNENNGDGSYRFEYETENKIYQQESGALKNVGSAQEGSVVEGSYSYEGPDGVTYTVNYIADENGFRATGDHIPTPPPIPEAIQKSLEQIAAQGYQSGSQYNGESGSFNQQSGYQY